MDDIFLNLLKNKIESGEIAIEEIPEELKDQISENIE